LHSNYFDLAVMINVLDHVCDAEKCMKKIVDIVKAGGVLIIGQDLTNDIDLNLTEVKNDIGHPIKVDHNWLDNFLVERFEAIIHNVLPRELGRNPKAHYGTYIFAGKKLK
jgi:hypothetical protein